jgi:hypothetical protein
MSIPKSYGGHYYTQEKIRNARLNIQSGRGKDIAKEAISKAKKCLEKGPEFYWFAVTSCKLPRNIHTNFEKECPVCGKEMTERFGVYSWIINTDSIDWKIQCPNCRSVFPSNDFKSYYKSGLDSFGMFDPEKADPKFLVNEMYPDKDPGCFTDNGFGWTNDRGEVWAFAAYYNLFGIWTSFILNTLSYLTDAYIYTGDMRCADIGLVILSRIADVYPDMHLTDFKGWKPYYNNDGGTGKGKIAGCISEPGITETILKAVDLFVPLIPRSEAVNILNRLYRENNISYPSLDNQSLSDRIYTNIVREVYKGVIYEENAGNTGMHEKSLALAAVVAGKSEEADEWIDWIFRSNKKEGLSLPPETLKGGNILPLLYSRVSRDGFGDEVSPTYNSIWPSMFLKMAKMLRLYRGLNPAYDLFLHPRFIKMAYSYIPLFINREYIPHHGDTAKCGNPGTEKLENLIAEFFSVYSSPSLAYTAWRLNGNSAKGLFRDLCEGNIRELEKELEEKAKIGENEYLYGSSLPAYGHGALAVRGKDDKADPYFTIYYGRTLGHAHADTLNIGYYNYRLDLMPDLGYPEYTDGFNRRRKEWESHTVSHNTVLCDKVQKRHNGGYLLGYAAGPVAGYVRADGLPSYPHLSRYDRSCALVYCGEGKSYIIDCFTVEGEGSCHYLLHGGKGDASFRNEDGIVKIQEKGTYAGEDVEYAKDPNVDYNKPYSPYDGSGFHYLKDVKHLQTNTNPLHIRWDIQDNWNVHEGKDPNVRLDVRVLSSYDSAALAKGIPPRNKIGNMRELDYFILRKELQGRHRFLSCISSWTNEDFIQEVQTVKDAQFLSGDGVAVKVLHKNGDTDYVLLSDDYDTCCIVEENKVLSGGFCILRFRENQLIYAFTDGGTSAGTRDQLNIKEKTGIIEGTVTSFTKDITTECFIDISFNGEAPSDFLKDPKRHRHVFIKTGEKSVSAFKIFGYEQKDGLLRLNIGNSSPIRSLKDPKDETQGFIYEIEEGMSAWIPISYEYINGEA